MQTLLDEKNVEVGFLENQIAEMTNLMKSLTDECTAVSIAKVEELSKQNRRLNAELKASKSKCKKAEESYLDMAKLLREKQEQEESKPIENQPTQPPSEVQTLSEKLEKANKKHFEVLNQNAQLKNELKMAQKCLVQEIGDTVSIAQLMSGKSNWRGRAQQIAMLNHKINELKDKLETANFDSFDEDRLSLRRLESMRRLEVENLSKELNECKSQLDENKQKVIALKARNKNLSDESNSYKLKTLDLLEKSTRDEEFIKCLNEQISMTKFECNYQIEEMRKEIERAEKSKQASEQEVQTFQCQLQNQNELISEKENEIINMKLAVDQLETNLRDISGDFLFSCRQMSMESYTNLLKNLEDEKNNCIDLLQKITQRLDKESVTVCAQHDEISKQRLKISRLEAKLREVEAEKEAAKVKKRRATRISEYSRCISTGSFVSSHPETNERLTTEIDKHKFK